MRIEDRIYAHRKILKDKISSMYLRPINENSGLEAINLCSTKLLSEIIQIHFKNSAEFVSILFLDTLINSCSIENKNLLRNKLENEMKDSVFDLYKEPICKFANLYPQMILGIKKDWSEEEVALFRNIFKEYIIFYFNTLPAEILINIKQDQFLYISKIDFPTLRIDISNNVFVEFQSLRREI